MGSIEYQPSVGYSPSTMKTQLKCVLCSYLLLVHTIRISLTRASIFFGFMLVLSGSLLPTSLGASTIHSFFPSSFQEEQIQWEWLEGIAHYLPEVPELYSPSAILFDGETGLILFEQQADLPIPPASLTKIMTIHLVLTWAQDNNVSWDQRITYSPAAYAENAPPRSSLMFLGPGHITTLHDLLLGLSISSGNDASVAAAELVSGNVSAFVGEMNRQARLLGLSNTYFEEPSGYSPFNQTTVRDFARFLAHYLSQWSHVLPQIHGPTEFTYPRRENLEPGVTSRFLGITQPNRNGLITSYEGADGLKTGYIDQAGYNLAFTAERNGFRLVGVVLGAQAPNVSLGSARREADAASLLDYGFHTFTLQELTIPESKPIRVWKSQERFFTIPEQRLLLPLPSGVQSVEIHRPLPTDLLMPVTQGIFMGYQVIHDQEGRELVRLPLHSPWDGESARGFRLFWDRIVLFFRSLFGYPQPVILTG